MSLSRRDFLKKATVGAAAVAGASLIPGLAVSAAASETPHWMPEKWDIETEVLVVGTGDGGCPAAIRAYDGGARDVLIIDKADFFGGCSVLGGGNCQLTGTHVQEEQGVEDRPEWAFEDTMVFGMHRSNPDVLQSWIDTSREFAKWMEDDMGVAWGRLGTQAPARVPRSHRPAAYDVHPEGSGVIYSIRFMEQLEKRNIPVKLEHRMTKIYREPNGPVLGIECDTPNGKVNIKATRAIILATGGFKGNPQMIRAYYPSFDETLIWTGWPDVYPTGDAHLAIMDIGGGCVDMSFIMEYSGRLGTRQYVRWERPHFTTPVTRTGLPNGNLEHIIFVENEGKRYLNEARWEAGHTLPWLPHMLAFLAIKGRPRMEWFVTDDDGAEHAGWTDFENAFVNPDPVNTPCAEPGWVAKADTIEDLAVQMGVPADNLKATIERYNEHAAAGADPDFERDGPLYPIVKPPFWAARWCRMAHDQCTGIRVNQRMQVVDTSEQWQPWHDVNDSKPIGEEKVIPHLYAAGECNGGIGGAVRGSGKRGWYMTNGYIAGDYAAKEQLL